MFVVVDLDVGHDQAGVSLLHHTARPQTVQANTNLLRYILQPRQVPGARAKGSLRQSEGLLTFWRHVFDLVLDPIQLSDPELIYDLI